MCVVCVYLLVTFVFFKKTGLCIGKLMFVIQMGAIF